MEEEPRRAVRSRYQETVVLLPGGGKSAADTYEPLLQALGPGVQAIPKDFELDAMDVPDGHTLAYEVEGVRQVMNEAGVSNVHLVGHSGGGGIALAFTATYPERVRSLALIETCWVGNGDFGLEELEFWRGVDRVTSARGSVLAFYRLNLRPGVALPKPPHGPPSPSLQRFPLTLTAMFSAFRGSDIDRERFRGLRQPIYVAFGSLSNSINEEHARILFDLFPDTEVEAYEGLHHFNPPHEAEPERFATALRRLWERARDPRVTG